MRVPSKYHWLPVEALLVNNGPDAVMTGAAGIALTVTLKLGDTVPGPHELVPFTVKMPLPAVLPKVTVMLLVVAPEVMVAPAGTVQT